MLKSDMVDKGEAIGSGEEATHRQFNGAREHARIVRIEQNVAKGYSPEITEDRHRRSEIMRQLPSECQLFKP